jgi:Undecaprenyl-phosphate glucose phosphotransferase
LGLPVLKEKRQLFEAFFMVVDLVVIGVAWLGAYYLRFFTTFFPVDKGIPPLIEYVAMLPIVWLIWAYVFKRMGLYRPMRGVRRAHEIWLLLNANALSLLVLVAFIYLFREKTVEYSRLVFVVFGGLSFSLTILQRGVLRYFLREIRRKGYNLRYMLVIGEGKVAADIVARVRQHRELGIQLLGCLSLEGKERKGPSGVPIVGKYMDVGKLLSIMDIDQIVVALPVEHGHFLPEIMSRVGDSLVDVKIVPDLYQFISVGGAIEEFEGLPVISMQATPMDGIGRYAKRFLDIAIASLLIVALSPVLLLIALLIRLGSKGPVLYTQERVSFDGSRFSIIKFRTMRMDAEEGGPGWTIEGDSRVTLLGKILRSSSLDELPQLFNVLRGDMSIVGPRPERPVFIEEFRRRVPRYMLRHKVPAGMTGWAQIHGWRGNTSIDKRIEYDLYYIENWSIFLDLKILLLTFIRGFRNRNAY